MKRNIFPARILIVKTSSLGDIVQALNVLDDLHRRVPNAVIDWVVEAAFQPIVAAHPFIRRAIALDIKGKTDLWKGLKDLRREKYDLIFDLQGNCKSGAITWLSRGKIKVGYGLKSVREWPNILATHIRYNVSKQNNIRTFYLELIASYFQKPIMAENEGVRFKIDAAEEQKISEILARAPAKYKIMVCPGSKWINKQLELATWIAFLQKIEQVIDSSFFLVWGDASEKSLCETLALHLKKGVVVDKLPLPTWQNLMNAMDLIIAVDSSALHLCGTTLKPSFSIFGPTSPDVFRPIGRRHFSIQGTCPYGRKFDKQCPVLRTCPTGACIKNLTAEELFAALQNRCALLRA